MIKSIIAKYREEGCKGVFQAIERRLFPSRFPVVHPVQIAIDEVCEHRDFTIVQIGAFIGDSVSDPLFKTVSGRLREISGRLICVEPVKAYYDQLVENYRDVPNVSCENVAISDRAGLSSFFHIDVDPAQYGYPRWLRELGSLKKEQISAVWDNFNIKPELKAFYNEHGIEQKVECITFRDLVKKYQLDEIDLLQIDAEGYELEILSSIDFSATAIRFVGYESLLNPDYRRRADRLMRRCGYNLVRYDTDTFAYKRKDAILAKRWSR